MAGPGRAGARGSGRHAPAGVSWGRASGWAGPGGFASRSWGASAGGGGPRRGGEPRPARRVAEGGVRPRSLPVPACVQDLRDGLNAFLRSTWARTPSPLIAEPCVRGGLREAAQTFHGETRAGGITSDETARRVFSAFAWSGAL